MVILGLPIHYIFVGKYDHPYYKRLLDLCIKGMQCENPLGWRQAAVAFQSLWGLCGIKRPGCGGRTWLYSYDNVCCRGGVFPALRVDRKQTSQPEPEGGRLWVVGGAPNSWPPRAWQVKWIFVFVIVGRAPNPWPPGSVKVKWIFLFMVVGRAPNSWPPGYEK